MLHARPAKTPANAVGVGNHFVYVVDDEQELRKSACFPLIALGIACIHFPSGEAFLKELDKLERGCILLDLRMAGRDGLAVQRELP